MAIVLPTFLALALLVVAAAHGAVWKFSSLNRIFSIAGYDGYLSLMICRGLLLIRVGGLSLWISERWVLRDADVCSARSVTVREGRASFMFVDRSGEYYQGEAFPFGLVHRAALAGLALYNIRKPELNKIGTELLFHRLIIVGRILTDLDHQTVAAHTVLAPPSHRNRNGRRSQAPGAATPPLPTTAPGNPASWVNLGSPFSGRPRRNNVCGFRWSRSGTGQRTSPSSGQGGRRLGRLPVHEPEPSAAALAGQFRAWASEPLVPITTRTIRNPLGQLTHLNLSAYHFCFTHSR